jgi:hypothetical protein
MSESIELPLDTPIAQSEYEVELERWFRRRFGWLCVAFVAWVAIISIARVVSFFTGDDGAALFQGSLLPQSVAVLSSASVLVITIHFYLFVRPKIDSRDQAVRAATQMILALGATTFVLELAMLVLFRHAPIPPLFSIFFWHLVASLFLPWTPRESLRPILPLLVGWAVFTATRGALAGEWLATTIELVRAPLILVPGVAICHYRLTRHRRKFRREASRRFFVSLRRELQQARRIHESLFPEPFDDGIVRFEYRYRPAQEIGGDYVHVWTDHLGIVHVTILDVTGHGLGSAMTVHRIYGELERLRYEHPYLRPGSVLSLLNRYVLLTMAQHKIFATAALLRIDPRDGTVMYANGGHPPMLLRSRSGAVREFDATMPMLGVLQPQDFGVEDVEITIEPGDTVVLLTDGVFESRDRRGRKWGLARLRDAMKRQPPPPKWPDFLLSLVEGFTGGALDDDLLVASLTYVKRPAPSAIRSQPKDAAAGATASDEPMAVQL